MSLSLQDLVERDEPVILDVRIRAEDPRARPRQELAQLVAERGARVVRLGLEGHPEDPDRLAAAARRSGARARETMYAGRPSLTCIAAWPIGKWSLGEGRQLHRVLEQARAGGEARAGQVRGARVVLADRAQDVRVVHARLVGDHEELVRDGELHVAPGVGEQLGQLGLLGRGPDRLLRRGVANSAVGAVGGRDRHPRR